MAGYAPPQRRLRAGPSQPELISKSLPAREVIVRECRLVEQCRNCLPQVLENAISTGCMLLFLAVSASRKGASTMDSNLLFCRSPYSSKLFEGCAAQAEESFAKRCEC